MYKLLNAFFKTKYNFTDDEINKIIAESKTSEELAEWYSIAIIFYEEEMERVCP